MPSEKEPFGQEDEKPQKEEGSHHAPEKKESRIDTAYSSSVSRYFNGRKNKMREVESEMDDDDLMYEQFLTEQQYILSKIAHQKKLEKMQPTDVSFALAELSGVLAFNNPESPYVNNVDENLTEELIQEREDLYLDTKKLYMESCKKMFPDTEVSLSPSQIHLEIRKIKKVDLFDLDGGHENPRVHVEEFLVSDIIKLLKENPKELLKRLDEVLYRVGDEAKTRAVSRFELYQNNERGGEIEAVVKEERRLAALAEPLYKLQLVRDELLKKIYGNSDMKPSERIKVNKLKSEIARKK